jgi:hypothetical protein
MPWVTVVRFISPERDDVVIGGSGGEFLPGEPKHGQQPKRAARNTAVSQLSDGG